MQETKTNNNSISAEILNSDFSESLINILPCSFAIVSLEGKFLKWNNKFEEDLEYTALEISQLLAVDFFDAETQPLIVAKIGEAFQYGKAELEAETITKSGKRVWYLYTAVKISYNGEDHIASIGININDKKEAEKALIERESRYNSALEGIDAGVWDYYDFENHLLSLSPKYLELIGRKYENRPYTLAEVEDWLAPEDRAEMEEGFSDHVSNNTPYYTAEVRYVLPNGEKRWFSLNGKVYFDKDGAPLRATGSIIDIHDRKTAENALKERKEQLKLFIEHSPVALAMFDTNMRYLAISRRWMSDLKVKQEDIIGKVHYDVFPEISDEWKAIHQRALKGEVLKNDEEAFLRADGTIDWVRWEVRPWYKASGEVGGIIIFSEVITENKETELKFRNLVEQSLVGVYIIQDGKYAYVNPKFAELFGFATGEMEGLAPLDFVYEQDRPIVAENIRMRVEEGIPSVHYEIRCIRKDGSVFYVEAFGNTTQYKGKPAIVGNLIDISDRRKSAADLRASLKELSDYKIALDESSIVAITDQKGIINYVNDNFCSISKYSREELIGQDHRIINSGYHSKEFIRELWRTIANGKIWRGDLCNRAKDGSIYWVETTIVPFLNEQGKPWQYVAIRSDITERNRSAAALRESIKELNDYKIALDESSIVAITDQKGVINYVNDNFCSISKYSREELIGQDHRIINSGYHPKEFIRDIWVTIANGNIWRGDLCNRAKDGSIYWVQTTIVPFLNEQGKPWQYVAIRSDITQRKLAEEAIRVSEETRRLIMDSAIDAIVCINTEGEIILWTPQAEKIFGWKEAEVLGRRLSETIIPPNMRNSHSQGMLRHKITGEGKILNKLVESIAIDKNGMEFPVEMSITPIEKGDNKFFCGFIRDIRQRKANEMALVQSEANIQAIFDSTDIAYTLIDKDFKVLSYNNEAYQFGKNELNWEGKVGDYLPGHFAGDRQTNILAVLNSTLEGNNITYETSYVQADGNTHWYLVKLDGIKDSNGQLLGILVAIINITESKIAQLQREKMTADIIQRNKDLEQFAYIVSHNLRAPVANIIGFANELKDDTNSREDKKMFTDFLGNSVEKLDGVIKDLNHILQVKREVSEHKEAVSLNRTVNDIKLSIKNMIDAARAEIETDFSEIDIINTTKSYLHSIFYNLISNSIKYRRPDVAPHIQVRSRLAGPNIIITFTDNGMGIDLEAKRDQVFGLYKRFHTQAAEGKGMGLYMTKTQVETIGGRISIESRINEGTTFTIVLPI